MSPPNRGALPVPDFGLGAGDGDGDAGGGFPRAPAGADWPRRSGASRIPEAEPGRDRFPSTAVFGRREEGSGQTAR